MRGRALDLAPFLIWAPAAVAGLAGVWLVLQGSGPFAIALFVLLGALAALVLRPAPALALLVVTRFSFEMFWDQRLYGFSVLDFLGAGVPLAVLLAILFTRPSLGRFPIARPLLAWALVIAVSASIFAVTRGFSLVIVENTLRYTCGIPIFLLTVLVVRDFEQVRRLLGLWLLGAVPVAIVFFAYGDHQAMEYHGVIRMKAFYHDVVTPAVVGCMAMLISLFLLALGWMRGWRPPLLGLLAVSAAVFARVLYLTFHNALAGVAFLSVLTFLFLRRRFGLLFGCLLFLVALSQVPRVQQRWWRETAILRGEEDAIAFASGRPNQWRYYLAQYDDLELVDKNLGVHGTWGDPENQFLQLLGDLGPVLGLFTLGLLGWILWSIRRWALEEEDPERKLFLHFVLAVLFGSGAAWITATPLTYSNFQWFLLCLVGLAVVVRLERLRRLEGEEPVPGLAA